MSNRFRLTPDLITWTKIRRGVYESCCGAFQVRKSGSTWIPEKRSDIDQPWQPVLVLHGKVHGFTTLTIAQQECQKERNKLYA